MIQRSLSCLGVASLLLAQATSPAVAQSPPASDYLRDAACRTLDNTFECARAIEARQVAIKASLALRRGDTLLLRLSSGRVFRVADQAGDGATPRGSEPASYSYFGRLPAVPFHLIHVQYGEGNAFALVHEHSGWMGVLEGWPTLSPDKKRLLVAEAGYFNRIGIFLYAFEADSIAREWHYEPKGWVPGSAQWRANTDVEIEQLVGHGAHPDSLRRVGVLSLRHRGGKWAVVAP